MYSIAVLFTLHLYLLSFAVLVLSYYIHPTSVSTFEQRKARVKLIMGANTLPIKQTGILMIYKDKLKICILKNCDQINQLLVLENSLLVRG